MRRSFRVLFSRVLTLAATLALASIQATASAQVPPEEGDSSSSATNGTTAGGTSTSGTTLSSGSTGPTGPGWGGPGNFAVPGDMHPCDRPPPGILTRDGCSLEEGLIAADAIDEAGYIVWRARQLLHRIVDEPNETVAEQMWQNGFNGFNETGTSLQNWFGDFSPKSAALISGAFDDI